MDCLMYAQYLIGVPSYTVVKGKIDQHTSNALIHATKTNAAV